MEELNDDELQNLLNQGLTTKFNKLTEKDSENLLSYQKLFKALETAPSAELSFSFASNVKRILQDRLNRKSDIRFNIMAVSIFGLSLALGYGLLQLINQSTAELVLTVFIRFKWILFFVAALFFCVLTLDQRLLKREY